MADRLPVWRCDECGGPAKWTFLGHDVYYHCEQQCDGFMQMDLFARYGVEDYMRGDEPLDAGRSSAVH